MRSKGLQAWFWGGLVFLLGALPARAQAVPPEGGAPPEQPAAPADPSAAQPGAPDPIAPGEPEELPPPEQSLPPPPAPPPVEIRTQPVSWQPRSRFGAAVLLGGGVDNLVNNDLDDLTGLGAGWSLRLVSGTREPVAAELSYVGDARDIAGPGITTDDYVLRNGFEGSLRLQIPIVLGSGLLEPFVLGGLGWSRYTLVNESASVTFMKRSDDQMVVPLGIGLAAGYRGFMFDARFTYRLAMADDLFGTQDMAGWSAGASLGAEF
jgi:hypothetical protein